MHANTFTTWARKLVGLRAGGRVAELEQARADFAKAYAEHRVACKRQDYRRMGEAAARLRIANRQLLQAESGL